MSRIFLTAIVASVGLPAAADDATAAATDATQSDAVQTADATVDNADDAEGVVRLTGFKSVVRGQDGCLPGCDAPSTCDGSGGCGCGNAGCGNGGRCGCGNGRCGTGRGNGYGSGCRNGMCGDGSLAGWWACQKAMHRHRNSHATAALKGYMAGKFGYFCPSANCGEGMGLCTKYGMVYALDPGFADPRDAERYAAPGQGVHLNVPLAPNVRHAYNFSWGVPSSRLTPVRHAAVVGPPQPAPIHGFPRGESP